MNKCCSIPINVLLFAGVKTRPSAFHELQHMISNRLNERGYAPNIEMLFPYGEADRNLIRQLIEVRFDLSNYARKGGLGGRAVWNKIKPYINDTKLLMIGHSGGGIAAYQIGKYMLHSNSNTNTKIVQIGSPKTKIIKELRDKIAYFHSLDESGQLNDPISKIGSWGGWSRDSKSLLTWNRNKYAPGYISGLQTLGGHADYFRHQPEFRDQANVCNLEKTVHAIEEWLNDWL